jgi:hypothetical protein
MSVSELLKNYYFYVAEKESITDKQKEIETRVDSLWSEFSSLKGDTPDIQVRKIELDLKLRFTCLQFLTEKSSSEYEETFPGLDLRERSIQEYIKHYLSSLNEEGRYSLLHALLLNGDINNAVILFNRFPKEEKSRIYSEILRNYQSYHKRVILFFLNRTQQETELNFAQEKFEILNACDELWLSEIARNAGFFLSAPQSIPKEKRIALLVKIMQHTEWGDVPENIIEVFGITEGGDLFQIFQTMRERYQSFKVRLFLSRHASKVTQKELHALLKIFIVKLPDALMEGIACWSSLLPESEKLELLLEIAEQDPLAVFQNAGLLDEHVTEKSFSRILLRALVHFFLSSPSPGDIDFSLGFFEANKKMKQEIVYFLAAFLFHLYKDNPEYPDYISKLYENFNIKPTGLDPLELLSGRRAADDPLYRYIVQEEAPSRKEKRLCRYLYATLLSRTTLSYTAREIAFLFPTQEISKEATASVVKEPKNNPFSLQDKPHNSFPLHEAAADGNRERVETLLSQGERVDVKDKESFTPLDRALAAGHWDIVTLMASHIGLTDDEVIERKFLAHLFEMDGISRGVSYESFNRFLAAWKLRDLSKEFFSDKKYAKELGKYLNEEDISAIIETLLRAPHTLSREELNQLHKKGKTLLLITGWHAHITAAVVRGKRLIKCNRGDGSIISGLEIFEIKNSDQLIEMLLELQEKGNREDGEELFCTSLNETLALTRVDSISLTEQPKGICGWYSAQAAFLAVIYERLLEKGVAEEAAKSDAHAVYELWKGDMQERGLRKYQERSSNPDRALLRIIQVYRFIAGPK